MSPDGLVQESRGANSGSWTLPIAMKTAGPVAAKAAVSEFLRRKIILDKIGFLKYFF
jgi:hypothetical protein